MTAKKVFVFSRSLFWVVLGFLRHGISHPEFMVTSFTNFKRYLGMYIVKIFFTNALNHSLKKIIVILQRTSRLVIDPSTVNSHAFLFGMFSIQTSTFVWLSIPLQSIATLFSLVCFQYRHQHSFGYRSLYSQ